MFNQTGFSRLIIMAVVVLLLVGVGAYYLGTKNPPVGLQKSIETPISGQTEAPSDDTNPVPNAKITSVPTPVPTPDPTADWKTYSNQKYSYFVKYPTSLKSNEFETSYDQYVEFTLGRDASGNAYLPTFTIQVAREDFKAKSPVSVNFLSSDWVNDFYNMNIGDTKKAEAVIFKKQPNMTIAGQSVVVIEVDASGDKQQRIFLKNNGYVFMISNFIGSAQQPTDFPNFLSSFKFTN